MLYFRSTSIVVFLMLSSNSALGLNSDEEQIVEMCRINQEIFDSVTVPYLPDGKYEITENMRALLGRLHSLMDGSYSMPASAVKTFEDVDGFVKTNSQGIIIAANLSETNNRIVIGHTLHNTDVKKELSKLNVLFVDTTFSEESTNLEEVSKIQHYINHFSLAIAHFTKDEKGNVIKNIGFSDQCVTPSQLAPWLEGINKEHASNNSFKYARNKRGLDAAQKTRSAP